MSFYDEIGVKPLINASETYTNLGGSLMDPRTLEAMRQASEHFVDMGELMDAVCARVASLTRNEAAFVTTGAAGGMILATAALMCGPDEQALDRLPDASELERDEVLIFDGAYRKMIPYWRLARNSGAKLVPVANLDEMIEAAGPRTAGALLFAGSPYERDVPDCEQAVPVLKRAGIRVLVDAAAQLPPASNLWHYTRELGADLCFFSGGKHIRGPQSTGLIVGDAQLIRACRMAASPNARIGRAFKTGKEELAGFLTALELFVAEPEQARYQRQQAMLERLAASIASRAPVSYELRNEGRLGTEQPLLLLTLPDGKTAADCNAFTRARPVPVDVGVYPPEFGMPETTLFLNAYNLQPRELDAVADAVVEYCLR